MTRGSLCLPGSLQPRAMMGIQQSPGTASFELPASSLRPAWAWALLGLQWEKDGSASCRPEMGSVWLRGLGLALPLLRGPSSTLTEGTCLGRVHICSPLSTGRPTLGSLYLWSHLSCQASGGLTPCPLPRSRSAPRASQAGEAPCMVFPGSPCLPQALAASRVGPRPDSRGPRRCQGLGPGAEALRGHGVLPDVETMGSRAF